MGRGVVDASVVVKWFQEEEFSREALRLRDDYVADVMEVQAPALLPFEVLNALRFSGGFSTEELGRVAQVLDGYAILGDHLEGTLAAATIGWAFKADLSVYDASYIALAQELSVPLYSADEQLLRAAGGTVEAKHIRLYRSPGVNR